MTYLDNFQSIKDHGDNFRTMKNSMKKNNNKLYTYACKTCFVTSWCTYKDKEDDCPCKECLVKCMCDTGCENYYEFTKQFRK